MDMLKKLVLLATLGLWLGLPPAYADDVYTVIVKRQEQKKSSQWTLSEWLETKHRIAVMDMWLAFHTPTPYEFYLGGNFQFGSLSGRSSYTGGAGEIAAYATIFGLEYQREQSMTHINNVLFDMRVFGYHNQSTNLTLQGGLRTRGGDNEYRSPVLGVKPTLYLTKYFGIDGLYRHIFTSNSNSEGNQLTGDRFEAGGFIDFNFVRVYLSYFHEQEYATNVVVQQNYPIRSGALAGVRLFF